MVTLSIYQKKPNKSGNTPVYIRVYMNGQSKFIRLPFYLTPSDLTPKGKIKNKTISNAIQSDIIRLNNKIAAEGIKVSAYDIDDVMKLLTEDTKKDSFKLDFFEWVDKCVKDLMSSNRASTAKSYKTAKDKLIQYYQSDRLDVNDMSRKLMQGFVDWCPNNGISANSLKTYMSYLSAAYTKACDEYNSEDIGKILITRKPFEHIQMPAATEVKKRVVNKQLVKLIYDLNSDELPKWSILGRDIFIMSYCLCGMNAKDMYMIESIRDRKVDYVRTKTKRTAGDRTRIVLTIPDEVSGISDKYMVDGRWKFHKMYSQYDYFLDEVNRGIKKVGEVCVNKYAEENGISSDKAADILRVENLSFYSARHTWSTVASSCCDISSEVIDKCLCHAGKTMADKSYIERSYEFADRANRLVLDATFH